MTGACSLPGKTLLWKQQVRPGDLFGTKGPYIKNKAMKKGHRDICDVYTVLDNPIHCDYKPLLPKIFQEISDILHRCGIKRNIDVNQLYLVNKGIIAVPDLSRFPMLRRLWLNNNKIKNISCLNISCCLTELYLHDNAITSISGALSHLTCLTILSLHNNELRRLEESVRELKRMQSLHTVSFFLNPLTLDPQYRCYVVHYLPSVKMLDRKEVKQEERKAAFQQYSPERHRVLQSLAFGRRADAALLTGSASLHVEGARATGADGIIHQ